MSLQPHAAAYAIIAHLAAEIIGCKPSQVQPDVTFESVGADSLDLVEIVMAFEDEFGVEMTDEDAEKITKPADLVAWLVLKEFDFSTLVTPAPELDAGADASPAAGSESTAAPESSGGSSTPASDPPLVAAERDGLTSHAAPTLQQLFDRVVTAVLKQGRPSVTDGGCAYRGDDGAKCAVGHLITDAVYARHNCDGWDNSLESNIVQEPVVRQAIEDSLSAPLDQRAVDMLGWLQAAHDDNFIERHVINTSDPEYLKAWRTRFTDSARTIARIYKLSPSATYQPARAA